ncbi:MAG: ABC transporter permease subunit [Planctomycetaceae bacterium]|jgi:oligopeptide transport system permease protein|nr:ABC transporter permease subunit [Planctomycetaceae bacterium]MBT4887193.1 ABC transporter permease subunit [Planctomycetaceae bacterium]MBT6054246.1 ABC transporter permease subunit [Planctomycetaceae bacterium]MBT6918309.1 ABC transporter permease subunit [Planctomycetaceae bacterium]
MIRILLQRLLELIPTALVIVAASFALVRLAPGSPFSSEKEIPPEVRQKLEAKYGFDKPLPEQFIRYLGNLLRGDLGLSTKYPQRTVNEIIANGFPVTLSLAAIALLWSLLVGITAGIIGAIRQNTIWDHVAMTAALVGISVPSFVLGPLLVLTVSLRLHLLPPAGWGDWQHVVLPGLTLGTIYAASIARLTRGGMLEVVRSDFIRTARAKGLSESLIVWRHMLRGGLLPVVSYLGPAVASMLTGSVVVEKIFNVPGIGPYFVDAAFNRDYFLVMGIVLLYAFFLLLMNLIVDVVYGFLDPRVDVS